MRKESLCPEKETRAYKLRQEIEDLTKQRDEKIKEVKKKAVESLATRIKFNSVFGEGRGAGSQIGLKIAEEIEKLILEN